MGEFVLDRPKFSQANRPTGFKLLCRQVRLPDQIGKDLQRGRQIVAKRGTAKTSLRYAYRFAPLDAQVLQVGNELATVARTGTSQHHLTRQSSKAAATRRIVATSGGYQNRKCRRLHGLHGFPQQNHTIGKLMNLNRLRHD